MLASSSDLTWVWRLSSLWTAISPLWTTRLGKKWLINACIEGYSSCSCTWQCTTVRNSSSYFVCTSPTMMKYAWATGLPAMCLTFQYLLVHTSQCFASDQLVFPMLSYFHSLIVASIVIGKSGCLHVSHIILLPCRKSIWLISPSSCLIGYEKNQELWSIAYCVDSCVVNDDWFRIGCGKLSEPPVWSLMSILQLKLKFNTYYGTVSEL